MYKRRDLAQKIDKLSTSQIAMAKLVHNVTIQARKDRQEYIDQKKKKNQNKLAKMNAMQLASTQTQQILLGNESPNNKPN